MVERTAVDVPVIEVYILLFATFGESQLQSWHRLFPHVAVAIYRSAGGSPHGEE